MWVTLELDPKTDEWVPIGTTHILGQIRWFFSVAIPETVWPLLIAVTLVLAGILSAIWGYSGGGEEQVASAGANIVEVFSIADPPEIGLSPEQTPTATSPIPTATPPVTTKNSGGKVSVDPANANLWLSKSPPVSDYRSVSAGNWLSE